MKRYRKKKNNKEQIRYYTQSVGIDYWNAMDEGTTMYNKQGSPIQTGIVGLDNLMDGELGVILAPFGVGKTTLVTRMLKPTDKLSPKKKTITHKMDMT